MHALGTLAGLDRRLRRASLLRAARAARGSAVDNARRSLAAIARSRTDRDALQQSLVSPASPGDLAALDRAECLALLSTREIGRVAFVARAGVPQIVPVNYELVDRHLLVRTGPGPLVQAAQRHDHVAFEVDDLDEQRHAGWSVVVQGTLTELRPTDRPPADVGPRSTTSPPAARDRPGHRSAPHRARARLRPSTAQEHPWPPCRTT